MARLKLNPSPTFKADVMIPVPGDKPAPVKFTFKHRTKEQASEFVSEEEREIDAAAVMEMAEGWDLEDDFTAENVGRLLENYIGAAAAIFITYIRELRGAREKN
jgi:hypothetical protein